MKALAGIAFLLVVTLGACSTLSEEKALADLARAEAVASELVAQALGEDSLAVWERSLDPAGDPFCTGCVSTLSLMVLEGPYERSVVEEFAAAADRLALTVEGSQATYLQVSAGSGLSLIDVFFNAGRLEIQVVTPYYHPSN